MFMYLPNYRLPLYPNPLLSPHHPERQLQPNFDQTNPNSAFIFFMLSIIFTIRNCFNHSIFPCFICNDFVNKYFDSYFHKTERFCRINNLSIPFHLLFSNLYTQLTTEGGIRRKNNEISIEQTLKIKLFREKFFLRALKLNIHCSLFLLHTKSTGTL